jgi:peptidoglycan/xylan/chitin deacetylase (PgdA/CDA1 family)
MNSALPVLMYHGLHADPAQHGRFDPVYSVHPRQFAQQLDWLGDNGYRTRLLRDLPDGADDKRVVITFDDGDVSNAEVALPALRERGMLAEFFVTADFVEQPGMLAAAQVRALADAGMSVQSHGATHRYLADLSEAELEHELADSKRRLEAWTRRPVDALALPGGRGAERERIAALRLGYRHVLNSVPGANFRRAPDGYFERIAVTREMPLAAFSTLVQWRGAGPRLMKARYELLAGAKRVLGNQRYERLRARMLAR